MEAIAEDLRIKTVLFENLDEICKQGAILVTLVAAGDLAGQGDPRRPQDVIGMHFFGPLIELVEVVSTVSTSDDVAETTQALSSKVGKVAVSCGDRAGFIVNALLFPT